MESASRRFTNNPSFSSTLLDEIYRSVDEKNDQKQIKFGAIKSSKYRFEDDYNDRRACLIQKLIDSNKLCEKTGNSSSNDCNSRPTVKSSISECDSPAAVKSSKYLFETVNDDYNDRTACLIQKLIEEKLCEKTVIGRPSCSVNSRSSDCDSHAAVIESVYGIPSKPKPIRTTVKLKHEHEESTVKAKIEGKFVKTKSKAFKIYSELKKVKQPISPGGRLSSFLHSVFTGKTKNSNTAAVDGCTGGCSAAVMSNLDRKSKSANVSTCSSASSFSRSCLSNSSSSKGKLSNGTKRSVRFYPVSVIVDEDCKPCGEKSLHEEVARKLNVKKRQNSKSASNLLKKFEKEIKNDEDEEYSDGGESESSSDLFELDNLSVIGMSKYREELPVYEMTYLNTNQAIANGRFM